MSLSFLFSKNKSKNGVVRPQGRNGQYRHGNDHLIELRQVVKRYRSAAGAFTALNDIDLTIDRGEFVGIIGKSGSGKSTLINMVAGIDRPTEGEVLVGDTAVHQMSENAIARWRGRNLGIVFQFFQLLPTLSVIENVMLPMDFCKTYLLRERRKRAMALLDLVDMSGHAYKLPSALSGGQQQRVAIARALANDPPVLIADEPTGNLDSKTADAVFSLFERLIAEGKTVVMVTHDSSLAQRVSRTVIIADGEIINEFIARALSSLSPQQMLEASQAATPVTYAPGATIIQQDTHGDRFYIITRGSAVVALKHPDGADVIAAHMGPGQYFGEISLFQNTRTVATVRAASDVPVEMLALDRETFSRLLNESPIFRETMSSIVQARLANNAQVMSKNGVSGEIA